MATLTISEARKSLTSLSERLNNNKTDKVLRITKKGKEALALMPWETYQSMVALINVLHNSDLLEDIQEFEKLAESRESYEKDWSKLKVEMGL